MSYAYNDAAMLMATQVAYLDFNGSNQNVGDVVDGLLTTYGVCEGGKWTLKPEYADGEISSAVEEQFKTAVNIVDLSNKTGGNKEWRDWQVVDVCNDQNDSGFYGMLIDTGEGNAIIGCRGSESFDAESTYKDWVEADVGLLDSAMTKQQQRAEQYMKEICYKHGYKYDSFSLTGHSLGGNLAEHMAITAPEEIWDKINHCINFDGPGYSDEYILKYAKEIMRRKELITHYQWSWVASLLNSLPGVEYKTIEATDDKNEDNWLMSKLWRHATYNVNLDEDGNVKESKEDIVSRYVGPISKDIENINILDVIRELLDGNPDLWVLVSFGLQTMVKSYFAFHEIVQSWDEIKADIYYNYFAPQVSGEYEINMSSVGSLKNELDAVVSRIKSIEGEIDSIRRNLQYWSASGAYYKSKIYFIQSGLGRDREKLRKLATVLSEAISSYRAVDAQVAGLFS